MRTTKLLGGASAAALLLSLWPADVLAQTALPTIDVGAAQPASGLGTPSGQDQAGAGTGGGEGGGRGTGAGGYGGAGSGQDPYNKSYVL